MVYGLIFREWLRAQPEINPVPGCKLPSARRISLACSINLTAAVFVNVLENVVRISYPHEQLQWATAFRTTDAPNALPSPNNSSLERFHCNYSAVNFS